MRSCGWLVVLILLGACSPARRGIAPQDAGGATEVGPGGDNLPADSGAAWFAAGPARKIHYCLEVAPGFGIDQRRLAEMVEDAFKQWREYLVAKRVSFPDPLLALSTYPVPASRCDGSEDLTVYFGGASPEVRRARRNFVNPTAFPARREYQPGAHGGWGRGFVWIADPGSVIPSLHFPDWTKPATLGAILRHEVGHTLGFDHVPGTIMALNISEYLRTRSPSELSGIDIERELFHCEKCLEVYRKTLPIEALGRGGVGEDAAELYNNEAGNGVSALTITVVKIPAFSPDSIPRPGPRERRHLILMDGHAGRVQIWPYCNVQSRRIRSYPPVFRAFTATGAVLLMDAKYEAYESVLSPSWNGRGELKLASVYNGISPRDGSSKALQLFFGNEEVPLVDFVSADRIPLQALDENAILRIDKNMPEVQEPSLKRRLESNP